MTVDRRSHGTLRVENTAISVLGGIQPEKIKALGADLAEDGMLQRFLPVMVVRRGRGEDAPPNEVYASLLSRVAEAIVESEQSARYKFAPEADRHLRDLQDFQQAEIQRPFAAPALRQWLDKLPNEFGRLSLVFHFIEWHSAPEAAVVGGSPPLLVSAATALRAKRFLTEFAYPHARVFHQSVLGRSRGEEHATWIAGHILSRGLSVVTLRDIYRHYAPFKQPDMRRTLPDVMQTLEAEDWLQPLPGRQKEGRPTHWTVNPAVHTTFAARASAERDARLSVQASIQDEAARRRGPKPATIGDTLSPVGGLQ